MAQRKTKPATPDPLSEIDDSQVNDPLADLGDASETPLEVDPLDALACFGGEEEPPAPVQGLASLKGQTTAKAIRESIPDLSGSDPLVLQGIQEIQVEVGKLGKLASTVTNIQTSLGESGKQVTAIAAKLAELVAAVDAGFATTLGAIAELKEHKPAPAAAPATQAAAPKAQNVAARTDNVIIAALVKLLQAKRTATPSFVLRLGANPAAIWNILSVALQNAGHTVSATQVEELVTGAGMVVNGEVKF